MKFLDCNSAQEFLELTNLDLEAALKIADQELNELKNAIQHVENGEKGAALSSFSPTKLNNESKGRI